MTETASANKDSHSDIWVFVMLPMYQQVIQKLSNGLKR